MLYAHYIPAATLRKKSKGFLF